MIMLKMAAYACRYWFPRYGMALAPVVASVVATAEADGACVTVNVFAGRYESACDVMPCAPSCDGFTYCCCGPGAT